MVTEIHTCGLMNEQVFIWSRRKVLHMYLLFHWLLRKDSKPWATVTFLIYFVRMTPEIEKRKWYQGCHIQMRKTRKAQEIFDGMKSVAL